MDTRLSLFKHACTIVEREVSCLILAIAGKQRSLDLDYGHMILAVQGHGHHLIP